MNDVLHANIFNTRIMLQEFTAFKKEKIIVLGKEWTKMLKNKSDTKWQYRNKSNNSTDNYDN